MEAKAGAGIKAVRIENFPIISRKFLIFSCLKPHVLVHCRKTRCWSGDSVPDTDFGLLFQFARHCRIRHFTRFIGIVSYSRRPLFTKLVEMTEADKEMIHYILERFCRGNMDADQSGYLDSNPGSLLVEATKV